MKNRFLNQIRCEAGWARSAGVLLVLLSAFVGSACNQLESVPTQKYFSEARVATDDEFRWSNGSEIKTLDPAKAIAAPESDVVKALYEGLTDLNAETFEVVPAVAKSWEESEDGLMWSFSLRDDARWSNGDSVTAHDFIRSWKRLSTTELPDSLGRLVGNIRGFAPFEENDAQASAGDSRAGVALTEATDDFVLMISLVVPDPDLPKILAHQIFRPVHSTFTVESPESAQETLITNGPFKLLSTSEKEIVLEKSPLFWAADDVAIDKVRFVMSENAEIALDEYRDGNLDAVTNFEFEPLALKLLSSYSDFKRSVHSAVNVYEFNADREPFNDSRVRQVLSLALDRDQLVQSETAGAMRPATSLVPFIDSSDEVKENLEYARKLLGEAGFPGGKDFPTVTLVINRNDLQMRVARFVARTWKNGLGIEVQIEQRELREMEAVRESGEYHLIRRGLVFPTPSRRAALNLLFNESSDSSEGRSKVIALYFPKSYALVKPSVRGFTVDTFGASSLRAVAVDKSAR
jgi:oligopeptide transport system substrate-binding protein